MDNENITTGITELLERLLKILTPNECLVCGEQNGVLCFACENGLIESHFAVCYGCGARSDTFKTCEKCRRQRTRPTYVWAFCRYQGLAKKLIYQMKFDSRRDVARYIADRLTLVVPREQFDVVTYVPGSPKRIRQRGYDHARLIAKEFAKLRGLDSKQLLVRTNNSRQVGARAAIRRRQAAEAFVSVASLKKYDKVLLIDDVITTGATIEACAKQLKKADVRQVFAATFAISPER